MRAVPALSGFARTLGECVRMLGTRGTVLLASFRGSFAEHRAGSRRSSGRGAFAPPLGKRLVFGAGFEHRREARLGICP